MHFPNHQNLDIQSLSRVFKKYSNSYKFYWFYSLLQFVKRNQTEATFNEMAIEMLANIWYPNHYFKLNFGIQDKLGNLADEAVKLDFLELQINTKQEEITTKISDFIADNKSHSFTTKLKARCDYVPYRFIRPWFENEMSGFKDSEVNRYIRQNAKIGTSNKLPYYFQGRKLIFDEDWFSYFQQHLKIMEDFCLWNLLNYMQNRNPNVPNIATKLFSPLENENRGLNQQRTFWNKILKQNGQLNKCIYSNQIFDEYALDHFIPWSFVTHNQLWNLIPIPQSVNSQKSNNLPKLEMYFEYFADLQYQAFRIGYDLNLKKSDSKLKKSLEDYLDVFHTELKYIRRLSENDFKTKLRQQIEPLSQIAANMGFTKDWIYQE